MRIVHVANFYGPRSDGLRTTLRQLGTGYQRAGHEFFAIVPGTKHGRIDTTYGTLITVPALPLVGAAYSLIPIDHAVRKALAEIGPDRLEVSDRLTMRRLGSWARKHGVPAVLFCRDTPSNWILQPAALRDYDRIVCVTADAAERFRPVADGRVSTLGLGVDLEVFSPLRWSAETRTDMVELAAVSSAVVTTSPVLLIWVGRLAADKNPLLAVETVRELRGRGVDAQLIFAGVGPLLNRVERASSGLPIEFLGFIDSARELSTVLATADVVLSTGAVDTFSVAALEALASGTPVVALAGSATSALITHDAGLATEATAIAFADATQRVLARRVEVRRTEARHAAAARPWSAAVATMIALHESLGDEEHPIVAESAERV